MWPSNSLSNKILSDTYWRVQVVSISSGSQFFRTTTGMQSGPDAFDESRFVMTFLTILEFKATLYNSILVLEGETGKEN